MSGSVEITEELITFDEIFDITKVASYHEQLSLKLNQNTAIVLNGENIDRIDGAALQMLLSFFQAAESLGMPIKWQACSEVLKKSAKLSGLTGNLGID
jgi:anti-anti-sigma regulatory factor